MALLTTNQMNYKQILDKLPGDWNELLLKDYIKLSPVINESDKEPDLIDFDIFTANHLSDIEKNMTLISLLTDIPMDVLDELPTSKIFEMIDKLKFMQTLPDKRKPTIKYIQFEDLTYDSFVHFNKLSLDFTEAGILSSAIENIPSMLAVFAKDKNHNEEYFLNQSMVEVIAGFFTLQKNTERFLQRSQASSFRQLNRITLKTGLKMLMQSFKNLNPFNKSSTNGGTTL
ncbi:hypothetical protein ACVW0P_004500 [Mucilaginibacter sp. UYNi724]